MTDRPDRTDDPRAPRPNEGGAPAAKPKGAEEDAKGDFAAPYGYGHKAHSPDPKASYGFDLGPPKTLPLKNTTY
jgi:hypothetical protein